MSVASDDAIVSFLPAIREYVPVTFEDFDTCVVCRDGECGGACPGAMYVVRQVLEALDTEDDRDWWSEEFGLPIKKRGEA